MAGLRDGDSRRACSVSHYRGMRVSVEQILDALAAGVPEQELLEDYPVLGPDDIRAILLYARDVVASERIYPIDITANREQKIRVVREIVSRYGDQLPNHFCVYRQGRLRVRS